MFKSVKRRLASTRMAEEQLYALVADELRSNIRRDGLWAKAIAKSEGKEEKARALYMQYRVQSLQDEYELLRDVEGTNEDDYTVQTDFKESTCKEAEDNEMNGSDLLISALVGIGFIVFVMLFAASQ